MPLRLPSLPRRALLTLALVGLAVAACDSDPAPEFGERDLIAVVDGDTFVGILADGEEIVVYACDGTDDGTGSGPAPTVYQWIFGANAGGDFDLKDGGVRLVGAFADDGTASGTLTLADGLEHAFTASPASGEEGVYLAEEGDYKGGWVVIADDVRGAVINRNTGDLISGSRFQPSMVTVEVEGVTLTPAKMSITDF
ncbi:MAG: hypothetical protein H6710_21935 [Myxococcales bacterium]|nr:hypothetical protein [Myxococcales bacterium]